MRQAEHLEAEDLILELADWACLFVAERLGCLLHCTNHWRRAANENFDIVGWRSEAFLCNR